MSTLAQLGMTPQEALQFVHSEKYARARDQAKDNYLAYLRYVHGFDVKGRLAFKDTPQAVYLSGVLQEAMAESERLRELDAQGLLKEDDDNVIRIVVSMPPQHGKSMVFSETFPSWFIGRNPKLKAHVVSYNGKFAVKFGSLNRDKIVRFGKELFGVELEYGNSRVTNYSIEGHPGGGINSVGYKGGITGEPGHLIIVDDPYKDMADAESPVTRERVQSAFESAIEMRMHVGGILIVVHTRWHEDDLISFVTKKYEGRVKVVNIPAQCEDEATDPLHRKEGEYLKFRNKRYYLDNKKNERLWNAMFQQRPSNAKGTLFKTDNLRSYRKKELVLTRDGDIDYTQFRYVLMSWDCTFKDGATNDFVAGQIWGYKGNNYYLLNRYKERMDMVDTYEKILKVIKHYPSVRIKLIEDKANGSGVIAFLKKKHAVEGIKPINPKGSKFNRAQSKCFIVNEGRVLIPVGEEDSTIEEFVKELSAFPYGKNDDEVDCMVQALTWIEEKLSGMAIQI